jgi:hypothetical protein
MKWKIDDTFSIETDKYSFMLRQAVVKKSDKTKKIAYNRWYYPTINMCLKRYMQESLKSSSDVERILTAIENAEAHIDSLSFPTLSYIAHSSLST